MAKRADAPYVAGRSPHWLKVRADHEGDFVVVGYTEAKGSRAGLGAIHLAQYEPGPKPKLVYSGRAGSGFTDAELKSVQKQLDALRRKTPPCEGNPPKGKEHIWTEPKLVAVARFTMLRTVWSFAVTCTGVDSRHRGSGSDCKRMCAVHPLAVGFRL